MNQEEHHDPGFSDAGEADLAQYRVVSPFAVVALLLGLSSFLALLQPLLVILPLLGIAASLIALRIIAADPSSRAGRTVALAALALAVAFAAATPAKNVSRNWIVKSRARRFATQWLELVRDGQLDRAHQLTLAAARRQSPEIPLAEFYLNNFDAARARTEFFNDTFAGELAGLGQQGQLRFERVLRHEAIKGGDHIRQLYSLRFEESAGREPLSLRIGVQRDRDPVTGHGQWRVFYVVKDREEGTGR